MSMRKNVILYTVDVQDKGISMFMSQPYQAHIM